MRLAAALLLVLAAAAAARAQDAPSEGPGGWTMARLRSIPPEEVSHRLLGDVGRWLYPAPAYGEMEQLQLRQLHFLTPARSSRGPGVCEADRLELSFTPVAPTRGDWGDVPVRLLRVESAPVHFIYDLSRALRSGPPMRTADVDELCARIDPRERRLIYSSQAEDVVVAAKALAQLGASIRAGGTAPPIDCAQQGETATAEEQRDCRALVSAIDPSMIEHAAVPRETADGVRRIVELPEGTIELIFGRGETMPSYEVAYGQRSLPPLRRVRLNRPVSFTLPPPR